MAERLIQKEQAQGLCQGTVGTGLDTISSPQLVISFGWEGCFFLLSYSTAGRDGDYNLGMMKISYNFVSLRERCCGVGAAAGQNFFSKWKAIHGREMRNVDAPLKHDCRACCCTEPHKIQENS